MLSAQYWGVILKQYASGRAGFWLAMAFQTGCEVGGHSRFPLKFTTDLSHFIVNSSFCLDVSGGQFGGLKNISGNIRTFFNHPLVAPQSTACC